MDPVRIRIETLGSSQMIIIHFGRVVTDAFHTLEVGRFTFPLSSCDCDPTRTGPIGAELIRRLSDISALESAEFTSRHKLDVTIGELFEWADTLPRIFDVIRAAFNNPDLQVDYKKPLHAGFTPPAPATPDLGEGHS